MSLSRQLYAAMEKVVGGVQYIDSRAVLCGSEHAYLLPVGKACSDFEKRIEAISAAVGSPIELIDRGGAVVVRVVEKDFPASITYKEEHLKNDKLLIGYDRLMNPVYHRLMHLLVGGASRAGKTVWLRWFLYQLERQKAQIRIADLKGFSFFPFEFLPGVEIAKSLGETAAMLGDVWEEIEHREDLIIGTRNRGLVHTFTPYVVVIDEAAQISPKMNASSKARKAMAQYCDEMVSRIAQKGAETKVILIYCTQKPTADIVNGQVKANVETALAFRTNTYQESTVILGTQGAEKISIASPGRCLYRSDRLRLLQVPFISDDDAAWEKLLLPFKTEVIDRGHSERSEPPRTYLEGSYRRSAGDNKATGNAQPVAGPVKTSVGGASGHGTGEYSHMAMGRPGKGVGAHKEGAKHNRQYSDEID